MPFSHRRTFAPAVETFSTMSFSIFSSSSRKAFICSGSSMLILASNSVFSTSSGESTSAIFASSILLGIPGWTTSLSRTMPLIRTVSRSDSPGFFSTLMSSISTRNPPSGVFSATCSTALTASSDISLYSANSLLARETSATFLNVALSVGSTLIAIWSRISSAFEEAARYPSTITVG